jgi:PmbA protein
LSQLVSAQNIKDTLLKIITSLNKKYDYQFNVTTSNGVSVNCRFKEVENIEYHNDTEMTVTVFNDYKKGNASTNDLSVESIEKTITKAENISKNTQPDEYQGLPEANFTLSESKNLGIFYPQDLNTNDMINLVKTCEEEAFNFDKRIINSEGAGFSLAHNEHMILNTKEAFGSYKSTDYSLSCVTLAEEKKSMERDYWYSSTRDYQKLETAKQIGIKAAERTIARLGAKTISTRSCPVIFSPEMSSSIIGSFLAAISGPAIYKKSSFLLEKLNQKIFPDFIKIKEEPHITDGSGTKPYDCDGVLTIEKSIIKNGTLNTYLLDTYSSRKLDMKCTGNGVITNIAIESDLPYPSDLIETLEDGILITEMMGSGANILTGDYSRGAFGYLIKNGKIIHPVTEITVASNLLKMFENIKSIGNDFDLRNNIRTGSILIDDITIGGAT